MLSALVSQKQRWTSPFNQLLRKSYLFNHFYSTTTNEIIESPPSHSSPPPIQVLLTESTGRGVFATRKIGSGQLIHTAQPIVSHPYFNSLHSVCYFCLKKLANGDNSRVNFCGDSCRKQAMGFCEVENQADWSKYDTHCRTHGLKYPLLVRRLACMVISGVASSNSLDILQPAVLSPQMIALMEEEFGLLKSALLDADLTGEKMAFLTKQWYIDVLARIRINAFRIELVGGSYEDLLLSASSSVNAEAAVGSAIYMLPSFYNHDCDPNVHILWIENVNARLKALRDIEEGEELRICYIDASMEYKARQTLLSEGYVLARIRVNAFRIELVARSYEDLLLSASLSVNAEAAVRSAIFTLHRFIIMTVIPMYTLYIQVKNHAYVILMLAWIIMLARLSSPKGLDLSAIVCLLEAGTGSSGGFVVFYFFHIL